ncbi:hypothetical protein ACTWPT_40650 [Nonomuraea sp. 3N208]|uniref:hypothetical protein n=1 Tax=Nonomuraea sp. 3N208 TaxID=3457421 RepID=UPI003FD0F59C
MRPSHYGRIGLLAGLIVVTLVTPAQAGQRPDIAADWFAQPWAAAGRTGEPPSAGRAWAIAWLAAQRALGRTGRPRPGTRRDRFSARRGAVR